VSEGLVTDPTVKVDGTRMDKDFTNSSGTHYVYSHLVSSSKGEGMKEVTATLVDGAGNITAATLGNVLYDFAAPVLNDAMVTVTPASPVGVNRIVTVTVGAPAPYSYAALSADPTLGFGPAVLSSTSAIWTHLVTASDRSGEVALTVVVRDMAGNETTFVKSAAFALDTVSPTVSAGATVTPSFAKAGTVVTATFDASEAPASEPEVTIGGEAMTKVSSAATRFVYEYAAKQADGSGAKAVLAKLVDGAGNSTTTTLGSATFDFQPPVLTANDIVVSPTPLAGTSRNLTVTATADEALGAVATITTDPGLVMGTAVVASKSAIWSHLVTASDPSGSLRVTVTVQDLAGNATTTTKDQATTLDTLAPDLVPGYAVTPSYAKSGTEVVAAFDTTEAMTIEPIVKLRTDSLAKDDSASTAMHFVFRGTVLPEAGQGPRKATVTLSDAAGNTTTATLGVVEVDDTAPVLTAADIVVTPSASGVNANLRVIATANEPLGPAATVTATGGTDERMDMGDAVVSGKSASWSHLVAEEDPEGYIDFTVTVEDLAGNKTTTLRSAATNLDTLLPEVQPGATVTPVAAKAGTVVTVVFDTSEDVGTGTAVTVGGRAMVRDQALSTARHLVFNRATLSDDAQGSQGVTATVVDLAGNRNFAGLGAVTFDFQPPRLVRADVVIMPASPIRLRSAIKVATTSDELLAAAVLETSPSFSLGEAIVTGRQAIWSRTVAASDPDGPFGLTITLQDPAGNQSSLAIPSAGSLEIADLDGDGYAVTATASGLPGGDCNDDDPNVSPGAPEVCEDGIDQNCMPETGIWPTPSNPRDRMCDIHVDQDKDGFTPALGDCNDLNGLVNPNIIETCNWVDDDCNGAVDDASVLPNCHHFDHRGLDFVPASGDGWTVSRLYGGLGLVAGTHFNIGTFRVSAGSRVGPQEWRDLTVDNGKLEVRARDIVIEGTVDAGGSGPAGGGGDPGHTAWSYWDNCCSTHWYCPNDDWNYWEPCVEVCDGCDRCATGDASRGGGARGASAPGGGGTCRGASSGAGACRPASELATTGEEVYVGSGGAGAVRGSVMAAPAVCVGQDYTQYYGGGAGGSGGGALSLKATDSLMVAAGGVVSADGHQGSRACGSNGDSSDTQTLACGGLLGGGGSGGDILLKCDKAGGLSIDGEVFSRGATGADSVGSGAGGQIKVFCPGCSSSPPSGITAARRCAAEVGGVCTNF